MSADTSPPVIDGARLHRFKPWLYAAAAYNLAWGTATVLAPSWYFRLVDMKAPDPQAIWQVVGMFVLVFAPGYAWAARNPERHSHFVVIGLLGKILGPAGFAVAAVTGALPLRFGLTLVTNDLIWWIPFGLFLGDAAQVHGGMRRFLSGD